jgi:hypothetical protein
MSRILRSAIAKERTTRFWDDLEDLPSVQASSDDAFSRSRPRIHRVMKYLVKQATIDGSRRPSFGISRVLLVA